MTSLLNALMLHCDVKLLNMAVDSILFNSSFAFSGSVLLNLIGLFKGWSL